MATSETEVAMVEVPLKVDQEPGPPTRAFLKPRQGKALQWSGLTYEAHGAKAGPVKVLDGVWGQVPPGKICAIMGPSGAGKSSLMNVLAGRIAPSAKAVIGGVVELDGEEIDPVANRAQIAYVMQDDTSLLPTVTPREALTFSAALRLDGGVGAEERAALVAQVLADLGLAECADTYVGGPLAQGISGGQRKRTSIGVDLITSPEMLFLDEPTSGLDSTSARSVVQLLHAVASAGATVACTIHQPSSEVFHLFDSVVLLRAGRVVYAGLRQGLVDHFAAAGFPCPALHNPADHVFAVMATLSDEDVEKQKLLVSPPDTLAQRPRGKRRAAPAADMAGSASRMLREVSWIFARDLRFTLRFPENLYARYGTSIFLSLIYGLVFLGAGDEDDSVPSNFQAHFGALVFITISVMFGAALPTALEFPVQRPVFLREYAVDTYSATSYFIAKMPLELLISFTQVLIETLITYFLIDLRGHFVGILGTWFALNVASSSFAVIIGTLTNEANEVIEALDPCFVPQLLFAGFIIRIEDIPVWLRWAQWLCSLKYAVNLILLVEFDSTCTDAEREVCDGIRDTNKVDSNLAWLYALLLVLLTVVFRSCALFILAKRARSVY